MIIKCLVVEGKLHLLDMATVNHTASIVIGQKAKFVPVENPNIPSMVLILYHMTFSSTG
ncbi:hypothetical protein Hanom_Chr06g00532101 [Helianthus anomalus]